MEAIRHGSLTKLYFGPKHRFRPECYGLKMPKMNRMEHKRFVRRPAAVQIQNWEPIDPFQRLRLFRRWFQPSWLPDNEMTFRNREAILPR